jgi:hypothetical protein
MPILHQGGTDVLRPTIKGAIMTTDFNDIKYNSWQTPEFGQFYADEGRKFYLYVKSDDLERIPQGYEYLYDERHGIYQLADFICYGPKNVAAHPIPPKGIYEKHGYVYILRNNLPIGTEKMTAETV